MGACVGVAVCGWVDEWVWVGGGDCGDTLSLYYVCVYVDEWV